VRIVLAENKIDYEWVVQSPAAKGNTVSLYNPLGKIPVLVFDDETTLYDSRVICEYLDTVSPNNRLIPASGRERITVKRWEALADGLTDAVVAAVRESKRATEVDHAYDERQLGKITAALKVMSDELGEQPWCHGNAFSLADIAVICALGYLSLRRPEIVWMDEYPNLAKLNDKLMQRPSFVETAHQ
jgi:glutathione S-transferase